MSKTSKIVLIVLLTLSMLLTSIANVKAVGEDDEENYRGEFSLTTDNVNVKVGDVVSIKINIVKVEGFKGISTFTAHKDYDTSIFEYVGIEPASGWKLTGDNVKFILNSSENHPTGTMAVMKFKALKEVGDTIIKLNQIDASGVNDDDESVGVDYTEGNVNEPSVKFKVVSDSGDNNNPGSGDNNNPGSGDNNNPGSGDNNNPGSGDNNNPGSGDNNNPGSGNNNNPGNGNNTGNQKPGSGSNNTNKNDKTTAKGKGIPQTGEPYMMFALLGVTILVAGVLFAKYKIFANKMK